MSCFLRWSVPAALLLPLALAPAQAGPVLCTTTLEAPPLEAAAPGGAPQAPVEITRCGPVLTTSELVNRRFFSYTSPFTPGVDITHQIAEAWGLAIGGVEGNRVMGFGYPEQTINWDGQALENTTAALLEQQSHPTPLRTADIPSGYTTSLAATAAGAATRAPQPPAATWGQPVRGLW